MSRSNLDGAAEPARTPLGGLLPRVVASEASSSRSGSFLQSSWSMMKLGLDQTQRPKGGSAWAPFGPYVVALAWVGFSLAVAFLVQPYAQVEELCMIHLMATVLLATQYPLRVSLVACVVSILALYLFFVSPNLAFASNHGRHFVTFGAMLSVTGIVSWLNQRLRHQEKVSHDAALRAETESMRSSLLSAFSHDLKTPLSVIIAAGTTLLGHRESLDEKTMAGLVSTMISESDRLNRLIQNVLSITRLEHADLDLHRSVESIEEIVPTTIDRLGGILPRERIRVELGADLPLVYAEPVLIEQVLVNLIENAARHSGAGSTVLVRAAVRGDQVMVQVADDGRGIPVEERERVFEKFYRGSSARKNDGGAGLGLTICRAIITAHGGKIAIMERPGGGTLVEFNLPLANTQPARTSATLELRA